MNCLNICIDIDGTITEPYYWLDYANKYFNLKCKEEQITQYDIAKTLSVSRSDYNDFYEKMKYEIHTKEKLRSDVRNVLDIISLNNNIYFVTARDKSLELLTARYLQRHSIPYDELFILESCNKVPLAKYLECDIFIEDSYNNAKDLSENGFKVLLLDTNYNRKPLNSNVTRVNDWTEIFQILNALSKKEEVI